MEIKELPKLYLENNGLDIYEWPELITIKSKPAGLFGMSKKSTFWDNVNNLRNYTDSMSDMFSKEYTGSTGWEYEQLIYFVYKDLFWSDVHTSKDFSKTSNSYKLEVKTKQDKQKVYDEVFINNKKVGTISHTNEKEIDLRRNAIANKKYYVSAFIHLHTHPKLITANKDIYYTLFSSTDLNSFFGSNIPVMGLVTNRLILLGKSKQMSLSNASSIYSEINQVSRLEIKDPEGMMQELGAIGSKYNIAMYSSEIKKFGSIKRLS